jgi:parallel beta-helix repeat protein
MIAVIVPGLAALANAQTPPGMPYNPWGQVTIDGQVVANGTTIDAYIDGTLVISMTGGTNNSYYALTIDPDDPATGLTDGGDPGDTIVVRVNGIAADVTLQWTAGDAPRVDLNVSTTRTIVVSPTLPGCQTGTSEFTSLETAVANANDGDAIVVCPGTYNENTMDITKEICINGVDPNTTIVNAASNGRIFQVLADNVKISGLTLSGANATNNTAAIHVGEAGDASQLLNVSNCIVTGNSYGIEMTLNASQVTIDNCTITNNTTYGIFVAGTQHTISNNDVSANAAYGIVLGNTQNHTLQGNTVSNNVDGIWLFDSTNNQITANTLQSNSNSGINLRSSMSNPIQQNTISLNNHGIYLEQSSTGNTISDNNITQNTTNLYNDQPDTIVAENTWWGTTICSTIDQSINDNEEGDGEVDFDPVLDAAYPAGISTNCTNQNLVVDVGPGCTAGTVYPDINTALANASSGDTIVVCPGNYTEMFTVTINLNDITITAFASDPNLTVVRYCNQPVPPPPPLTCGNGDVFHINGANNVTISGFTITGTDPSPHAGVRLGSTANNCTITRNIFEDNDYGVIASMQSFGNLIYNNIFQMNTVHAKDSSPLGNNWSLPVMQVGTTIIKGPVLGGNFWDDYVGVDLDMNGIGESNLPYNHNGNIFMGGDFLPLVR